VGAGNGQWTVNMDTSALRVKLDGITNLYLKSCGFTNYRHYKKQHEINFLSYIFSLIKLFFEDGS